VLSDSGIRAGIPAGSFYLWVAVPESFAAPGASGDQNPGWALTSWLAERGGVLVAPGDTYGQAGAGHVRVALVQPGDRLELVARRLATARISSAAST
jgi:aspartate/methionine/tyrosine aminotransferase